MVFNYKIIDQSGTPVTGQVDANNRGVAVLKIKEKHIKSKILNVLEVEEKTKKEKVVEKGIPMARLVKKGLPLKTKVFFFRQIATMLKSGLNLVRGLALIKRQEKHKVLKAMIGKIEEGLSGGESFAQTLAKFPKAFNTAIVAITKSGEISGMLEEGTERIAEMLEKQAFIRGKIRSASIYPIVIILITVGIFYFFLTSILPKFKEVFTKMKMTMPALTEFMFELSEFIMIYWLHMIGGTIIFIFIFRAIYRTKPGKFRIDSIKLKLPIFGELGKKAGFAQSARVMSSMFGAGVNIINCIETAQAVASNEKMKRAWGRICEQIKNGVTLAKAIEIEEPLFPMIVTQMVGIGEEAGRLDEMLRRVAIFFEDDVDNTVKNLTSIMEPMLILVVGGVVALIAFSIFGPITSAMQQIGK